MKTPGFLREELFYLRILMICMVLSISLQTRSTAEGILVENTSGPSGNHPARKRE
jgi:hypothetical protein